MKKVAVLGAGGFIGGHLVTYLKQKDYWVRGVDIKQPEFKKSDADEFQIRDLRIRTACRRAMEGVEEVYQLAADMGGMGFISKEHIAPLYNSNLINTYSIDEAVKLGVKKYFFSSSACVYPTHRQEKSNRLFEEDAIPANPNEAYGWEKLVHEQRCLAYADQTDLTVRIARFGNTYGPYGTYEGGREKAPAALCRKAILAKDGGETEIWGDGFATRSFLYVDDLVRGIYALMQSDYYKPINLGSDEVVTINELARKVMDVSGKNLNLRHVDGPVGIQYRNIDHTKAGKKLNWTGVVSLESGLKETYKWIESEIKGK